MDGSIQAADLRLLTTLKWLTTKEKGPRSRFGCCLYPSEAKIELKVWIQHRIKSSHFISKQFVMPVPGLSVWPGLLKGKVQTGIASLFLPLCLSWPKPTMWYHTEMIPAAAMEFNSIRAKQTDKHLFKIKVLFFFKDPKGLHLNIKHLVRRETESILNRQRRQR